MDSYFEKLITHKHVKGVSFIDVTDNSVNAVLFFQDECTSICVVHRFRKIRICYF